MLLETMSKTFSSLEDPRSLRNQDHPFITLIGIGLLATIAGIDSFNGMATYAECHEDELKRIFDVPHGVPSHDTLQRVFDAINPHTFLECFMNFTHTLAGSVAGLTAIDGKVIRNSGKANPLLIVSAWCDENRLVLGHVKAKGIGYELEAVKVLLNLLDLDSRIITLDALSCTREVAQQIGAGNGDYVIALKKNQSNLLDDVKIYFDQLNDFTGTSWREWDKGHGRIEQRECWALSADWLAKEHNWPYLRSIAMVKSTRIIRDKESHEVRFYVSSLPANAELIRKTARRHWSVENKLHWVLDVTFNEDKGCIRNDNAAENVDILRKWALNVLNSQKGKNDTIKGMQRKASMSFKYMNQLLTNFFHA